MGLQKVGNDIATEELYFSVMYSHIHTHALACKVTTTGFGHGEKTREEVSMIPWWGRMGGEFNIHTTPTLRQNNS